MRKSREGSVNHSRQGRIQPYVNSPCSVSRRIKYLVQSSDLKTTIPPIRLVFRGGKGSRRYGGNCRCTAKATSKCSGDRRRTNATSDYPDEPCRRRLQLLFFAALSGWFRRLTLVLRNIEVHLRGVAGIE